MLLQSWAISWPVIKLGVATVLPIWYACLRYAIATFCLFTVLVARHEIAFLPRSDWLLVAVSGVLQMAGRAPCRSPLLATPSLGILISALMLGEAAISRRE